MFKPLMSMSKESLREAMVELGLENIVTHDHRGFNVAWGTVPE